jgi:hypothetical protein
MNWATKAIGKSILHLLELYEGSGHDEGVCWLHGSTINASES